jgi:hypothetical protein
MQPLPVSYWDGFAKSYANPDALDGVNTKRTIAYDTSRPDERL